jgi:glycosyltransferase involved in cell wall biosynthesis
MHVLMLIHNMADFGGNYLRAFPLAASLVEMGFDITLIASRRTPGLRVIDERRQGVRVIQCADLFPARTRHGGLSPLDVLGRFHQTRCSRFDIIHGFSHRPAVSVIALYLHRTQHIPYISDWADLWGQGGILDERSPLARVSLGWLDNAWEQHVHRSADAVTAISADLARRAVEFGHPADRVRLIPVGANAASIVPLPKAAMRAEYGLPPDAPILVLTGFSPYDARFMAETFVCLAGQIPDLLLLKTGWSPPLFETIIAAAGYGDRLMNRGIAPYAELGRILACGDVMLLPFSWRGVNVGRFPNRFGDYLAAGRPIATNQTPDVGPIVATEQVGIAAPDEPEAFAAAIGALLANPDLREQMGHRARHLAETRYSWGAMAGRLATLYEELCVKCS